MGKVGGKDFYGYDLPCDSIPNIQQSFPLSQLIKDVE